MDSATERVVVAGLARKTGDIRDVKVMDFVAGNGGVCSTNRNTAGRHVAHGGTCWLNTHPDEGNVYDFSGQLALVRHEFVPLVLFLYFVCREREREREKERRRRGRARPGGTVQRSFRSHFPPWSWSDFVVAGGVGCPAGWVQLHPGNQLFKDNNLPNPIARHAEAGTTKIYFPGTHAQSRWDSEVSTSNTYRNLFLLIGKVGDTIDFAALPRFLQTEEAAKRVGAKSIVAEGGFESCGSRGEEENDMALGNHYLWSDRVFDQARDYHFSRFGKEQKSGIWSTVVMRSKDQLRQRTAFALSQILVTGEFGALEEEHELWSTYYDIFVANAFGNYRDILREVSASPLMGRYLTFIGNKAHAETGKFPDENYAREIMQLFTIGLYALNMDGTQQKDSTGLPITTYTNDDIMAFAKVWTGYSSQKMRSNIQNREEVTETPPNLIDPMKLNAMHRDRFPKTKLGGGHLGDGYPLCNNRPKQHYLRKGARYQYHGQASMLSAAHDNHDNNFTGIRLHFTPDAKKSSLYAQLCARDSKTGACTFPSVVTLPSTLTCVGTVECDADNLRSVKIIDGDARAYYTYVEPPCTRLMFFQEGRMATAAYFKACADPELADTIGTACCTKPPSDVCPGGLAYVDNSHTPKRGDRCDHHPTGAWQCPKGCKNMKAFNQKWWVDPMCVTEASTSMEDMKICDLRLDSMVSNLGGECKYIAEPMTYKTAQARCAKEYTNGVVCDNVAFSTSTPDAKSRDWRQSCSGYQADWTTTPCRMQVQVLPSGEVMAVDSKMGIARLKPSSGNTFRVEWGNTPINASRPFPVPDDGCAEGCYKVASGGGSCLCDIVVSDVAVVTSVAKAPPAEAELRSKLLLGAEPPSGYKGGKGGSAGYTMCTTTACNAQKGVRVYTRGTSKEPKAFGTDTIFELTGTPHTDKPTARFPGRYLLNRASAVHLGHYQEFVLLDTLKQTPIAKTDYMATKSASGRTCTYKAASEDNIGQICKGLNFAPFGADWTVQISFAKAQDACRKSTICTGILWNSRRGGGARTFGAYQLCGATNVGDLVLQAGKLTSDPNWVHIPATCKAVATGTCKHDQMTRIDTELECKAACEAMGQSSTLYESLNSQYTRRGCFLISSASEVDKRRMKVLKPGGNCKWNRAGGFLSGYNKPDFPHVNFAREVCRAKDMVPAIRLSTTPCKDRGLRAIGNRAECELAAASAAAVAGKTVGKSGVVTQGKWSHVPEGCSVFTDPAEGDFSVYWNLRTPTIGANALAKYHYSPLCHHADNEKNKNKMTGFKFRNPPVRVVSRSISPRWGQLDFVSLPARTPHGAYVW